jgi:hypothetical protein
VFCVVGDDSDHQSEAWIEAWLAMRVNGVEKLLDPPRLEALQKRRVLFGGCDAIFLLNDMWSLMPGKTNGTRREMMEPLVNRMALQALAWNVLLPPSDLMQ